ncbi:cation diffusion facilitator family transporter [Stenotrophomonas pictorum]|uniref:cation diffusion facilitator family transporter n=1 Tax=Stenotrophomonas pictorum TaxID=86184 RepID=UPI000A73713F|nr:cation transporter [Stenotrophomonas pictorum]
MDTSQEQRILKLSIGVTVGVSASGFFGGLLAGSQAVLFDGVYSLVDVALTLVALSVLRLVAREGSSRFQYGYWHLEPMVEAMGGAILSLACIYALANAVIGLTTGGHEVKLGIALFWSALLSVVNLVMSLYVSAKARQLQSALLSLDARAWFLSGMMSLAVLGAFLLATLLSGGDRQWLVPYLDSLVLAGICLAVLPLPLHTTWKAMREVLQVAPPELDGRVRQVMEPLSPSMASPASAAMWPRWDACSSSRSTSSPARSGASARSAKWTGCATRSPPAWAPATPDSG